MDAACAAGAKFFIFNHGTIKAARILMTFPCFPYDTVFHIAVTVSIDSGESINGATPQAQNLAF